MESIIEYKTGEVLNLDKSSGADIAQLAETDALKSFNLKVITREHNNVQMIGNNLKSGNPSAITYNENGTLHTVGINKIMIKQTTSARGVIRLKTTIQVMNPLNSNYQTLPMSSFNNGIIRTVIFNR